MDKDTRAELEQLRAQVAELSKVRAEQQAAEQEPQVAAAPVSPAPAREAVGDALKAAAAIDIEDQEALSSQLDQLLEQLEHEIRDLPTITTLAVFSLGVLFGRLLR